MSSDQDHYEDLRRILVWKRHEQPPPGFFEDLPTQVRWQIHLLQVQEQSPWWQRLADLVDPRPVLLGTIGTAVCGLFLFNLGLGSWEPDQAETLVWETIDCQIPIDNPPKEFPRSGYSPSHRSLVIANSSVTPVVSELPGDLWFTGQGLKAQTVSFALPWR